MTTNVEARPFLLTPKMVERMWGKTDLSPWYDTDGVARIGEAWLTGAECLVDGGELAGQTLGTLAGEMDGALGKDGEFPLLVKLLFPEQKLSVQVHPDDAQARAAGDKRGKTECWYVLDSTTGAKVACGLQKNVTVEALKAAAADGSIEELLVWLPVETGDMVLVDAGTVHAIGAGMTLLEVQQSSDTTFRLYDYGRGRELHLDEGLKVVKTSTKAGKVEAKDTDAYTRLIENEYFTVDRYDVPPGVTFELAIDGVGCVVGIKGKGAVNEVRFGVGQAVVAPVGSVSLSSVDGCSFLRVWEPK